MVGDGFHLVL